MCFFFACLTKIFPLYMYIILGYLGGKTLGIPRDSIARLMFYMISPIVMFNGIIHTKLHADILILPFVVFAISSLLCLISYRISQSMWADSTSKLVAYTAGNANTGYFGLPLALLLFDNQGEGIYIMALLGVSFYENTVGLYLFTSKKQSLKNSFKNLLKLPPFYALIGGLSYNFLAIPVPTILEEFMQQIKGAYLVLGMMIIGLGLAGLSSFKIDFKFIGMTFFTKFVVWPIIILSLISIDIHYLGLFNQVIYNALILLSIVPLAVNTVIIASLMNIHPEKAATAVLLGTIFAMIYVPVMAYYFIA